jgi:type IV secretion system protein VirB4
MKKLFYKILERLTAVPNEIPKLHLHVSDTAISFEENYISSVIEFDGIVFEAISNNVLENDFEALNLAYAETAKEKAGRLSFHCYQLRRKIDTEKHYEFDNKFCGDFAKKYLKRFNDTDYYANRFYIVFTLKYDTDLDEAINELEAVCDRFAKTLSKYEPKMLSVYTNQNGILCSEIWEFFYEIINSEQSVGGCPITGSPAYDALPASNLHFGFEILQIKGVLKNRFVALCDLKDFPFTTKLGMFNSASLALPFEYNFVQSFVALSPVKSLELIDRRLNELRSVKDKAQHQQDELELAQGYIQSGEMALGGYHAVLAVFGETQKEAMTNAISAMASFSNNAGAIFRKSTASAPASYFSQLPNYWYIPRRMMKSSRNLAGAFSMHNYSRGKATGNPIGDGTAIMPLQTRSKTLYDFNFHFTNPLEDTIGDQIAGHTLILGATGTGKTTLQTTLLAFTQRFNPAMFVLDKDRGMDIFIRALDGDYFAIEEGKPTGINPFQFKDNPKLREFLNDLVVGCANDGAITCTSEEQNQIKNAIDTVMSLPVPLRRFSALLQSIPARGGNELHARLLKWCNTEENQGRFAWVLDNPVNQFDPDDFKIVGFDVGSILKENYQPTEPLLACLLYLKSQMVKKHSLLCTVVEEFWLPLKYKTPQEMMLDVLKTGRKRGEFMILVTQSPEEAVNSPIFPAIVQQTPTKILLPNPDAEYKNEQGGGYSRIGLTQKEFIQLQRLALDSRTFLIKQGHQSSFGVLDLYGFDDEISVLSGTTKNVELLDEILSNFDKQPISDVWLPIFYEARRQKKMGVLNTKELVYQHLAKAS